MVGYGMAEPTTLLTISILVMATRADEWMNITSFRS